MKYPDDAQTLCPIARAVDIFCDRWTLLLLRELRMGTDRFDDLQAQTGISSNLLTQRLRLMEQNGLIERLPYQDRPKRWSYRLTDKACELDGILLAIRFWGMRHCGFDPEAERAVTMTHRRTGKDVGPDWQLPRTDQPFSFSQLETRINPGWAAERAARAQAFVAKKQAQVARRARKKADAKGPGAGRRR